MLQRLNLVRIFIFEDNTGLFYSDVRFQFMNNSFRFVENLREFVIRCFQRHFLSHEAYGSIRYAVNFLYGIFNFSGAIWRNPNQLI